MLIIYAHPNHRGHCGYILAQVEKQLKLRDMQYEVLDLYKMKYDPILHDEEHYTSGGYSKSDLTLSLQKKIEESKHLIFIYPTWWNAPPAILKGFVDKVFTARWAYRYINGIPRGLLKGRRALVFTTTGAKRFMGLPYLMDISLRLMTWYVLSFSGIRSKGYVIGNCVQLNDKQKKKIERKVSAAIATI